MILYENEQLAKKNVSKTLILIVSNSYFYKVEFSTAASIDSVISVKKCTFEDALKLKEYNKEITKVISFSPSFTLIPSFLASQNTVKNIATFNFSIDENSEILDTQTLNNQITVISTFSKPILNAFASITAYAIDHIACYICSFLEKSSTDILVALVLEEKLFLGLQTNSKIQFVNAFIISNIDEIMYYIMLIVQEYSVNTSQIKMMCIDDTSTEKKLASLLADYFVNVEEIKQNSIEENDISGLLKFLTI